jgi:hypothetical protein
MIARVHAIKEQNIACEVRRKHKAWGVSPRIAISFHSFSLLSHKLAPYAQFRCTHATRREFQIEIRLRLRFCNPIFLSIEKLGQLNCEIEESKA